MKNPTLLVVALISVFASMAQQQPFIQYGYKVKVTTLSNGKYVEHFDQDTIVQIGTVLLNRRSGKIVSFVAYDTTLGEYSLKPELISRWMSPDPLAHEFSSESPYNFGFNNPVRFVDPDGRAPFEFNGSGDPDPKKKQATPDQSNGLVNFLASLFSYMGELGSTYNTALGNKDASASENTMMGLAVVGQLATAPFEAEQMLIEAGTSEATIANKVDDAVKPVLNKVDDIVVAGSKAAKGEINALDGSFSVFNWNGYPTGGIKPTGPFRLLEGTEYNSARSLANSTNAALHKSNPGIFKGLQIHEIHPVKFGGSPTDLANKVPLSPQMHRQYNSFWFKLQKSIEKTP
jgi:hypothetical protein